MTKIKTTLLLILVLCTPVCLAWSAKGHEQIAQAAFAKLTPAQQNAYVQLLSSNKVTRPKDSAGAQIGHLARWPDQLRDIPLRTLFQKYGSGEVPRALRSYSQQNTNKWHYENSLYVDEQDRVFDAAERGGRSCPPARDGELLKVWPKLLKAYRQSPDPRDKTLLLGMILHLASDAYQPLHLTAGLKTNCRHDAGGNGFCVDTGHQGFTQQKQRCKLSLHQAWDRGFGIFDKKFAASTARLRGNAENLTEVITMHRSWADDLYPTTEQPFSSEAYQKRARKIAQMSASRATAHLTQLLKDLVPR